MSHAKVNGYRASIADAQAERAAVESQRDSHEELRAALERQVDLAADAVKSAARRISIADYHGGVLPARVNADGRAEVLPALIAVFGRDVILSNLDRHIDAVPSGPTKAERAAQIAAIDAEIEKHERGEEAAIRSMEAQGIEVLRRPDASPAVVLADLT